MAWIYQPSHLNLEKTYTLLTWHRLCFEAKCSLVKTLLEGKDTTVCAILLRAV